MAQFKPDLSYRDLEWLCGLTKLPAVLGGQPVDRPAAVVSQSLMAGLSLAYLAGLGLSLRK